jgi:3-oxoacyl-[acyl-carrier-protein] synthase II
MSSGAGNAMPSTATRRVVITGIGLISPLGTRKEAVWDALAAGRSGIGPLRCLPSEDLAIRCAGEVRGFTGEIADFGTLGKEQVRTIRKGLKVMCREIQMGVAAAQLALQDAQLKLGDYDVDRTGVVYGSDYIMTAPEEFTEGVRSCLTPDEQFDFARWATDGMPKVTPLWLLKYLPNMPASHVAIYNDLRGPNNSITLREASALLAVAEAYCTIVRGHAEIMIAGATGTRLHPLRTVHVALQEECAKGDGDPEKMCRPFDLHRRGMVLGEGAGAIVVEELGTAQARGVPILAEIVGFASSAAAHPTTGGDICQAIQNVICQALAKAGMEPEQLGHYHAHGLATRICDEQEAAAVQAVFGARNQPLPVTAAKSYMGNLGAAGGLVELISSVLALQHDKLFPILNYETPDPRCPIHAARTGDESSGDSFLKVSVTPQGQASAIAIRRAG